MMNEACWRMHLGKTENRRWIQSSDNPLRSYAMGLALKEHLENDNSECENSLEGWSC